MITRIKQTFAVTVFDKWAEVLGPERNGMNVIRCCLNCFDPLGIRIDNLKIACFDPIHEPGHVKRRDVGSAGGGENNFFRGTH